jgi:hypothetical protein
METIKAECPSCGGTGLYVGFAEPAEHAVICRTCDGTGCETIKYKPFEGRKRKRGVKHVLTDGGIWFARKGKQPTITVQEFYSK